MQPNFKLTKKVPTYFSNQKIGEVREKIIKEIKKFETIDYIYILTKSNKLKGVISIHELFRFPSDSFLREHISKKIIKAHLDTDKEKIAHLAVKNNIKAIPIVDKENKFLGIVRSDDILHILDSEAREDLMLITGVLPHDQKNNINSSIIKSFVYRSPWIVLGLFGGLLAAKMISSFEVILEKEIILVSFIPLVAYIANAVGVQTQTLYIRELAISHKMSVIIYGLRQIFISALIGFICWLIIVGMSLVFWHSTLLGMIVGFSVFCAILVATIFAIGIPYMLTKLNKDPAIGSGPFTTIIQDMLSILIYFLIASSLIL